jgi:type II secretory pathway pseudopilin PulG
MLRRNRTGLGLVEAMIALAICTVLLTAVAGAFSAASRAITENDEFFQATNTGRVAMNRILTQVRRGSIDSASTATYLHLISDTGIDTTYSYNATTKIMSMIITSNGVAQSYPLARNITSCSFQCQSGTDYAGNPCVARVAVSLTIKVDNNQILLSGSGTPRRNIAY